MPQIVAIGAFAAGVMVAKKAIVLVGHVIGGIFSGNRNKNSSVASSTSSSSTDNGQSLTIKTDAARRMIYGKTRVSGVLVYENVSGDGHEYLWMVIVLAAHKLTGISQIYFDGEVGPDNYSGYYEYWFHDGTQTTADANLTSTFSEWTAQCKLLGCSYVVLKLKYDKSIWKNGEPNPTFDVLGKPVYDPRTNTTAFSSNAALVINDFLKSPDGMGATDAEVNNDCIIAAANISDQIPSQMSASLCSGRYTCDGMLELSTKAGDTLKAMLAACAGSIVWAEGQFKLYVGATQPVVSRTLTADDLRDAPSIQPRTPADESYNGVQGTFIDSTNAYATTDFPPVIGAAYVAADGGVQQLTDVTFTFVTSPITAQRLATIMLRRARLEQTASLPCKWTAFNYEVWDVIPVQLEQFGWERKLFQITDWKMNPPSATDAGGIDLTVVEYSDDIYSDDMELKPITGGGVINVPDVTVPKALTTLTATSGVATVDASGNPRVRFDWPKSSDIYCTGYEIAYGKYPFEPVDSDYVFVSGNTTTSYMTGALSAGDTYVGYIRVVNTFSKKSERTVSNSVIVRGSASAFPSAVTGFTVTAIDDVADLQWLQATSADVNCTLVYWSPDATVYGGSLIATVSYPQTSVRLERELRDGYYSVAFMSNSGLIGDSASAYAPKRESSTQMMSCDLSRWHGDLEGAVWYNDTTAVVQSQDLASQQGWETFDQMVPNPITRVQYWSKQQVYVAGGTVKVSGAIAWLRAPDMPNVPPVTNASARVAYYDRTTIQQGEFTLQADANIKIGFDVTITDTQGNVFFGLNSYLEGK